MASVYRFATRPPIVLADSVQPGSNGQDDHPGLVSTVDIRTLEGHLVHPGNERIAGVREVGRGRRAVLPVAHAWMAMTLLPLVR